MGLNLVNRKNKRRTILYTLVTLFLLCALLLAFVGNLYLKAEEDGYENLHMQTKEIKDDIILQIISDRENLLTMASFAAKLHADGDSYDLLFNSFKPIGLIANIGILGPDNVFVTKAGSMDLNGLISFEEEAARGEYISGRIDDLTNAGHQIVRTGVPIKVNGEAVGVLYGVISLDTIGQRYSAIVAEYNAQLFVYDKENGDLIIDTVHDELGNISFLKDRRYKSGYSYEQMESGTNGFTSFMSAYKDETVYLHYSTIEELDWMIAFVRYDSAVFAETHTMLSTFLAVFTAMVVIIGIYVLLLMRNEKRTNATTNCASDVRMILLETSGQRNNISEALREVCVFARARSVMFFDTDGEEYSYISPRFESMALSDEDRVYFRAQLFHYATELYMENENTINVMSLKVNERLEKKNPEFYAMLCRYGVEEISFSATTNNANHITILGAVNAKRPKAVQMLAEKISACFSMALNNKNHLNRTMLAATTDSLTGALSRVAYKSDLEALDAEKPLNFACIYVDVNELHIRNNKYGHAAGDEMLLYIANTLKEVFFGHKVYRMGGDEFLVFCSDVEQDGVKLRIDSFLEQLEPRGYHVALGMSYRSQNTNTEEMVREAEVRMYDSKAKYYQNKEEQPVTADSDYVLAKTGILEIDTMLSVLRESYNGIYRVSLDTDRARRVLMPAYLNYHETEEHFSELFARYVSESAESDYHRSLLSFRNYEALKNQLSEGITPRITYKKLNGETVVLSVYRLGEDNDDVSNTLWVFAKK